MKIIRNGIEIDLHASNNTPAEIAARQLARRREDVTREYQQRELHAMQRGNFALAEVIGNELQNELKKLQ